MRMRVSPRSLWYLATTIIRFCKFLICVLTLRQNNNPAVTVITASNIILLVSAERLFIIPPYTVRYGASIFRVATALGVWASINGGASVSEWSAINALLQYYPVHIAFSYVFPHEVCPQALGERNEWVGIGGRTLPASSTATPTHRVYTNLPHS